MFTFTNPVIRAAFFAWDCGQELSDGWFDHCLRVAEAVEGMRDDSAAITTVWLHDVVEDVSGVTIDDIRCGFGDEVANHVDTLTRRPDEQYLGEYIERVRQDPVAQLVKLADLEDHLSRPDTAPSESYLDRCRKARERLTE